MHWWCEINRLNGLLEESQAEVADLERQLAEAKADGERHRELLLWVITEAVDDYWLESQILSRTLKRHGELTDAEWLALFAVARNQQETT
jgi:hypothetical protein